MGLEKSKPDISHDPTQASVLPQSVQDLEVIGKNSKGRDVVRDSVGRKFHEIEYSPRDQMFLSRLLKGTMPVSDVIYKKETGKFYSYVLPTEYIKKSENSGDELWADRRILDKIFTDNEHYRANTRSGEGWHILFDFNIVDEFWYHGFSPEEASYGIQRGSIQQLTVLKDRLSEVRKRCAGSDGLAFMKAILDSMAREGAGTPSIFEQQKDMDHKPTVEHFQAEILEAMDTFIKIIQERISEKSSH